MARDEDEGPATGRFTRLAKLAGLGARLSGGVMARGVKRLAGSEDSILGDGAAKALVSTLGELKGLAMKMGQAMSMDPDLLTPEIRAVIARLQNQAPPMPYATVRQVIVDELGKPPEELYAAFDETPLASASLGQVHKAVTKDGQAVAVKVQYPDIHQALMADLENVGSMVKVVSKGMGLSEGKKYYEELHDALVAELDYRTEAEQARVYARAAAKLPDLVVPRPVDALTAERVLTLELLAGPTLKELLAQDLAAPNEERFRAARLLVRAIWGPFLIAGCIHADPHPGNFLLLPDGRLGVLDFGSVTKASEPILDVNRRMFRAMMRGQPYDVVALSRQAGFDIHAKDEDAKAFITRFLEVATPHLRQEEYDFATCTSNRDLKAHILSNPKLSYQVRPPKDSVMFFRSLGGLLHNLQNLKAKGPFLAVHRELDALW